MTKRSAARTQFLINIMITAVEHNGYGFIDVDAYDPDSGTATVSDRYDDEDYTQWYLNPDVIAKGLAVIRDARPQDVTTTYCEGTEWEHSETVSVLHNADTDQRLYLSTGARREILLADRTNGEEGDLDVIDCLAVVECALFGAVTYG